MNRSFAPQDGDVSIIIRQIKDHMANIFQKKPVRGLGVITGVDLHPTQGYPIAAYATINGAQNQRVEVGATHRLVVGETWTFIADEDNIGRMWVPRICLVTDQGPIGINRSARLPVIQIPLSGVFIDRDGDYLRDASGGLVQTHVWINYRTIVVGEYDLFGSHVDQILFQAREFGGTAWKFFNTVALRPAIIFGTTFSPVFVNIAPSLSGIDNIMKPGDESVTVIMPSGLNATSYILNQPVYWGVENETFEGIFNGANTIHSIRNRSADSGSIGNHPEGSQVTLYSGQVDIGGLSSSTVDNTIEYEGQIAAVKQGAIGPFSVFIPFNGYLVIAAPDDITNFVIQQIDVGTQLTWDHLPNPHLAGYYIYRYDSVTPPVTPMAVPDPLPVGMKMISVASKNATEMLIPSPDATDPVYVAAYGTGQWFGIAGFDNTGNVGNIVWARDITPPPHPLPESWDMESRDISLHIQFYPERDTRSIHLDPGFEQFILYRATATDGSNATDVSYFGKSDTQDYFPPLDREYVYQLASRDRAGNVSALVNDDNYWKAGAPNFLVTTGFRNGTLNIPGMYRISYLASISSGSNVLTIPDLTIPHDLFNNPKGFADDYFGTLVGIAGAGPGGSDLYAQVLAYTNDHAVTIGPAASTTVTNATAFIGGMPDKWGLGAFLSNSAYSVFPSGWILLHKPVGGLNGSRVFYLQIPTGSSNLVSLVQRVVSPYNNEHTGLLIKLWAKIPAALAGQVSMNVYAELFDDTYGRVYATGPTIHYATSGGAAIQGGATVDGKWHEYWIALDDETMFGQGVWNPWPVSARLALVINVNNATGSSQEIWIDDISGEYY